MNDGDSPLELALNAVGNLEADLLTTVDVGEDNPEVVQWLGRVKNVLDELRLIDNPTRSYNRVGTP